MWIILEVVHPTNGIELFPDCLKVKYFRQTYLCNVCISGRLFKELVEHERESGVHAEGRPLPVTDRHGHWIRPRLCSIELYKKIGILKKYHISVYEKLVQTSDIMSVFKGIYVGHSSTFSGHFGCHKP